MGVLSKLLGKPEPWKLNLLGQMYFLSMEMYCKNSMDQIQNIATKLKVNQSDLKKVMRNFDKIPEIYPEEIGNKSFYIMALASVIFCNSKNHTLKITNAKMIASQMGLKAKDVDNWVEFYRDEQL